MENIYLDYNASTPLDDEVADTMLPYLKQYYGNPSSGHWYGVQAKMAVEKARRQVADFIKCCTDEIIFTSGGTESNNYAIKGIAFKNREKGNHIITSVIEHPAVLEVCRYLEKNGFELTYIPVDNTGVVDINILEKSVRPETILISVMHANNEVGTIQPIKNIAEIAKTNGIIMHTDAAQSMGKIKVNVDDLNVDLMSIAGHKMYAPKGIGALFLKKGVKLEKLIHGADHEQQLRAGTENVLEIVGLGKACEIAGRDLKKNSGHMKSMRDSLFNGLKKENIKIVLNGNLDLCLPNTLNISFPGIAANVLLDEMHEVAASPGAACHFDSVNISYVLSAMNVPEETAMGAIRFSTGRYTTKQEIEKVIRLIKIVAGSQRSADNNKNEMPGNTEMSKLVQMSGLGCDCKLSPELLNDILKNLTFIKDKNVLVGTETGDDAAIYKLNETTAIVNTVDFFTPIVNDPYYFGAIAAANAMSDIYAMGGKPLFALNIAGFPSRKLPMDTLKQIFKGAEDKASEAGISIIGGHTIDDQELKYGMAVTGIINPKNIIKNSNSRAGDALIITKPLGVGIISVAFKRGLIKETLGKKAIKIMCELNNKASEIMKRHTVNACTDISGYGLLGHLREMSLASKVDMDIYLAQIPCIPGIRDLVACNIISGGTKEILSYVSPGVKWDTEISMIDKLILCDSQTSGGLLISIPEEYSVKFMAELKKAGISQTARIGSAIREGTGNIYVRKKF